MKESIVNNTKEAGFICCIWNVSREKNIKESIEEHLQ